ncbi:MAG: Spy/CpxP family protein refolding chaperone [Pseudomonadota bacterium]
MRKMGAADLPQQGSRLVMRLMAVSVFVVAAAGAAFSAHAQGHHGPGRGGPGGAGMMMFGGAPEQVGRSVDRMLDGLNATDAQRTQIKQIATAAAADLKTQRDAARGLREKGLQIFTAPSVDSAAAEALRQQMSAQHEQASKRMLQAMLDVANVLTPEQRARIGERMKERQAVMKDRMQRMHQERPPRAARAASQPAPQK